jgi:hypothetical protein
MANPPPKSESNEWAAGGVTYVPTSCSEGGLADPCVSANKLGGIADDTRPDTVEFDAFIVYSFAACKMRYQRRVRQLQQEARDNLLACESKQIAREFWAGAFAQTVDKDGDDRPNNYLAKAGATGLTTSAGADPTDALACLEQYARDCGCGGRAMIHASADVFTNWVERKLVETDGKFAYTELGTIVVMDAGYPGTPPAGIAPAAGVRWAFVTDPVTVRRSDILDVPNGTDWLARATDRKTNEVVVRAERAAAVTFDGCCRGAAGVQVAACTSTLLGS